MHFDFVNSLFALFFAIVLVAIFWGLADYFSELGSEESKRHSKGFILKSVTWLVVLMVLFSIVGWIRSSIGI